MFMSEQFNAQFVTLMTDDLSLEVHGALKHHNGSSSFETSERDLTMNRCIKIWNGMKRKHNLKAFLIFSCAVIQSHKKILQKK